ncbi:MAG: response regulator [Pseudomonadota bacterium]
MINKKKPIILIADDNPQNLQFLGSLLSENGYEVGIAQDGAKALEFTRKNTPDLILLDIMMPLMDGYEACRHLKSNLITKHIPVIFLTARTETEDIVKGFEAGGVDYVTKPFNSTELLARVKTHIEMKLLSGLLPLCLNCKKIRDDEGMWNSIEQYMEIHADVQISHGLCPNCAADLYGHEDWYKKKS